MLQISKLFNFLMPKKLIGYTEADLINCLKFKQSDLSAASYELLLIGQKCVFKNLLAFGHLRTPFLCYTYKYKVF